MIKPIKPSDLPPPPTLPDEVTKAFNDLIEVYWSGYSAEVPETMVMETCCNYLLNLGYTPSSNQCSQGGDLFERRQNILKDLEKGRWIEAALNLFREHWNIEISIKYQRPLYTFTPKM